MATVEELSGPYANHLRPVLPRHRGVCSVCHTSVIGDFSVCVRCNEAGTNLTSTLDALDFIALAVKHEQLAHELWFYKNGHSDVDRRRKMLGLAAVLWRWLEVHESCVSRKCHVENFPVVTTVPSTIARADHPLVRIVSEIVASTRDRYRDILTTAPDTGAERDFNCDRFVVSDEHSGGPVLLIDDTFTTGSRIQSAACALKKAGYGPVGAVVIGRHFNIDQEGNFGESAKSYQSKSRKLVWDWNLCCLCDPRDPWELASET